MFTPHCPSIYNAPTISSSLSYLPHYWQIKMSYYGIHHANIETIICANCQTKVFAWLADVFACPECGHNFHESNNGKEDQEMYDDEDSDASTLVEEEERVDRKRKREELSEEDGR
jgi:predicted RNA-binding Zn-ribbon protein involved in translation (DUF1610 family)